MGEVKRWGEVERVAAHALPQASSLSPEPGQNKGEAGEALVVGARFKEAAKNSAIKANSILMQYF